MSTRVEVREIIIVAMEGEDINRLKTDATKWGEITEILKEKYDLRNLEAVVSTNKTTLNHPDAELPAGPFRLFLRQKDGKGGSDYDSMSFLELRNSLTDELKDKFQNEHGINWTNASKAALIDFFNSLDVEGDFQDDNSESLDIEEFLHDNNGNVIADFESLTNKRSFVESIEKSKDILIKAQQKLDSNIQDRNDFIDETSFRLEEAISKINEVLSCIERYEDTSSLDTISNEEKENLKSEWEDLNRK